LQSIKKRKRRTKNIEILVQGRGKRPSGLSANKTLIKDCSRRLKALEREALQALSA
jgi:hypothetical protein